MTGIERSVPAFEMTGLKASSPSSRLPRALAMVLFRYFPFGGMQSNFLRIAKACAARGHQVEVYTLDWQGEYPADVKVNIIEVPGRQNIRRYEAFSARIQTILSERKYDLVIGFNRMPGLDLYYAADPCFVERVRKTRPWYYPLSARFRHFRAFERSLFEPDSQTRILALSRVQIEEYRACYGTQAERFSLLPPGVQSHYRRNEHAAAMRNDFRQRFDIAHDKQVLLMIGSGFERKGFDRGLHALAALPEKTRETCHLLIVGKGREKSIQRLARRLGLENQFTLVAGSHEVPLLMQGADLLIHPARSENTGNVIVEAIAGGLPVLCSGTCGYAFHVEQSEAGRVLDEPFEQNAMNQVLAQMLDQDKLNQWRHNGLHYAKSEDLYSRIPTIVEKIELLVRELDRSD